jgi:hypothetical protein
MYHSLTHICPTGENTHTKGAQTWKPQKENNMEWRECFILKQTYCGVAPRGRSVERPLLINGYAYLAISLLDNGQVASNS